MTGPDPGLLPALPALVADPAQGLLVAVVDHSEPSIGLRFASANPGP